ncbi:DUF885 domain-containing protein [Novosphingobium sp.]|uniref:DUF885 domain-containing protein n=1 Tax=Novosphingobium sp. TaxID=1874826 RepID=UPI0025EC7A7D|nr:DUF885 domain-containing protein [Novosphingobium sp.]MCC6926325.1 DUF885 domain-containing protein [Novosphingobium sp.]
MYRKALIAAALPLAALALLPAAAAPPEPRAPAASAKAPTADLKFQAIARHFLSEAMRLSPVEATAMGEHKYDALLPDMSAAGRAERRRTWQGLLARLGAIDPARLSRANQVDLALLRNELRYRIWQDQTLQDWAWNAQIYNDIAAGSLYTLAARDFAPWPVRLRSATARMEALPAFLKASRTQLVAVRVPRIFAETVARQNAGIVEIAEGMLAPNAGTLTGAERARFDKALAGLKAAVADQQKWLDTILVPQAKGDFRLGPALYDQKMKFALMSDLTRPELKARALASKTAIRAEMYELSRQVLKDRADPSLLPDNPTPGQQQAVIESALALSYAKHPPRQLIEQRARETLAEATAFVRKQGFIRMPDGPVKVITMPKFQQGNAVAYNDPPGVFEKNGENFYAVSPIPDDWSEDQAKSYLSEYNDYMIHDLSIHEAMPGHYLQLDHSNRTDDVLRAYLGSGPFVEGWAVYAEGVMKDEGYLNGDPLFKLTVLKMRLRSVTNTLLDIGIQTEGLTRDQAMELMQKGAFQAEREAAGKWVRASLSSVQLLSYFTGYEEHRMLRAEAEQRWGKQFTLRRYHDTVLSYGSPPVKYVRALMFGLPVG